jgi:uncharacterized protein (DUF1330 family)
MYGDFVAPNAGLVPRDMSGIATLNHKAGNVAMKDGAIVLARGGQGQKVKGGTRTRVAIDFAFQISNRRMNRHGHDNNIYKATDEGIDGWICLFVCCKNVAGKEREEKERSNKLLCH